MARRDSAPKITVYLSDQLGPYREEILAMMTQKAFPGGYSASAWMQEVLVFFLQLAEIHGERDPRRLLLKVLRAAREEEAPSPKPPSPPPEPDIREKILGRALRFGNES
ncbi:MAG: hypothetical protein KM310_07010 [Clostridiales bacterium]|nr:hypothetical protein [Clostridiales bacterium]